MFSPLGHHRSRVLILSAVDTDGQPGTVAEDLRQRLSIEPDVDCGLLPVDERTHLEVPDHDILVLGLAVRRGDPGQMLGGYLSGLPEGKGRPAFGFTTSSAFGERATLWHGLRRLARQGYHVIGGAAISKDRNGLESLAQAIAGFGQSGGTPDPSASMAAAVAALVRQQPTLLEFGFAKIASLLGRHGPKEGR